MKSHQRLMRSLWDSIGWSNPSFIKRAWLRKYGRRFYLLKTNNRVVIKESDL